MLGSEPFMSADTPASSQPGLQFYSYEMPPDEELRECWGQLAGGMHRLVVVLEELEALPAEPNVERALRLLEYHVEGYLTRIYQHRDRALRLLAAHTGQKKDVDKLRHPAQREAALISLAATSRVLTEAVGRLLSILDHEISLRNEHEHNRYLSLGLNMEDDIYNPFDALADARADLEQHRSLEDWLMREVKILAEEYCGKIRQINHVTMEILKTANPLDRG
jgi:hypothetical protein